MALLGSPEGDCLQKHLSASDSSSSSTLPKAEVQKISWCWAPPRKPSFSRLDRNKHTPKRLSFGILDEEEVTSTKAGFGSFRRPVLQKMAIDESKNEVDMMTEGFSTPAPNRSFLMRKYGDFTWAPKDGPVKKAEETGGDFKNTLDESGDAVDMEVN